MIAPTVNVNGTLLRDLAREQLAVANAYDRLWNALVLAGPHPRDYPDGEAAYALARAQHRAELERVDAKRREAQDAALAIIAQSGPEPWRVW